MRRSKLIVSEVFALSAASLQRSGGSAMQKPKGEFKLDCYLQKDREERNRRAIVKFRWISASGNAAANESQAQENPAGQHEIVFWRKRVDEFIPQSIW